MRDFVLFVHLGVIIFLASSSYADEDPEGEDEKEPVDEIEDDFESDILKPLGPIKSSKVLRTIYYLSNIETNWFSARQHCVDNRLKLLSIEDLPEDSEITQFLNEEQVPRVWTSGNDLDRNGEFLWAGTFRPFIYSNWHSHRFGTPKDPRRNCVFTGTDKYWGDGTYGWDEETCATRLKFICEETF